MITSRNEQINTGQVLAKALLKAQKKLGLNQTETAAALGMHHTTYSRLKNSQKPSISPKSKQGELAVILVHLASRLSALTGCNEVWTHRFMRSSNKLTGGIPAKQIASIGGLMSVIRFVDSVQGQR